MTLTSTPPLSPHPHSPATLGAPAHDCFWPILDPRPCPSCGFLHWNTLHINLAGSFLSSHLSLNNTSKRLPFCTQPKASLPVCLSLCLSLSPPCPHPSPPFSFLDKHTYAHQLPFFLILADHMQWSLISILYAVLKLVGCLSSLTRNCQAGRDFILFLVLSESCPPCVDAQPTVLEQIDEQIANKWTYGTGLKGPLWGVEEPNSSPRSPCAGQVTTPLSTGLTCLSGSRDWAVSGQPPILWSLSLPHCPLLPI